MVCIARKSGIARRTSAPMISAITGTITTRMPVSGTSWRRAMTTPPTSMIGAETMTVRPIRTTIWTCWTSFVFRVISEAAPKWLTSTWENDSTLRKMPARRSRPNAIETLAAQ